MIHETDHREISFNFNTQPPTKEAKPYAQPGQVQSLVVGTKTQQWLVQLFLEYFLLPSKEAF